MEEFELEQNMACKLMNNMIKKNRLAHAYLIESNEYDKKNDFAYSFAKLLCDNDLNIEVIKPDGMWIKKEQIEILQKKFNTKSIIGSKKVYIIEEADKLNISSANTLLKFLEEPEDNIIAILVVDNLYQVLSTIKSRCQIINLINLEKIESIDSNDLKIRDFINFLDNIERRKNDIILYENVMFLKDYKNKEDVIEFINLAISFYKEILDYKLERNIKKYVVFENIISNIAKVNSLSNLCDKINILNEKKENFKINENINLLIDDIIIKFSEV